MDSFLQDLRYAVRTLVASPLVSALAVICLALGIGANATMFSVLDVVLLKPLPFGEPGRMVALKEQNARAGIDDAEVAYENFRDVQRESRTLEQLAAETGRSLTFTDGDEPVRYSGSTISWNLFDLLGVRPQVGRSFRPEEDRPGAAGAVILSDEVWRVRYNADPSIVSRSIVINDMPHTVVGVMPPRFAFPNTTQVWIPVGPIAENQPRTERSMLVIARLAPGATIEQAREELVTLGAQLAARHTANAGWTLGAIDLRDEMMPEEPRVVTMAAMGAVSLVLLIACANVANLLLARATARQREIAVRTAVGAGRRRILRQLLTESLVLGAVAAPFGFALTHVGLRLLDAGVPSPDLLPYYVDWNADARVLFYVMAVAIGSSVLFGLAPALQTVRTNLVEALKDGGRGTSVGGQRGRLRSTLVVAEIALSLILLVGAALFVRSFLNLQNASVGFDTAPLLTLRFYMPGSRYAEEGAIARRVEDVVRRAEALPGVEAVTASNYVPLGGGGDGGGVLIDGRAYQPGEEPRMGWASVTPGFVETLGLGMQRGRDFTRAEGYSRARVAIVNATMAARFWPEQEAVGQRFRLVNEPSGDWFTIIGVVRDVARGGVGARPVPFAYVPHPFMETPNTGLVIRASGDPAALSGAVREALRASDPTIPVFAMQTMQEVRERGYWQYRLFSWMFSVFGAIALVLAAIGVYGVLAYSVSQRAHEIGVRMALGASRRDVVGMITGQGLRLAALGILVGVVGAAGLTQGLRVLLFNVSTVDPVSYGTVAVFLAAVALAASWLPARRATRVDPIIALRSE